MSKSQRHFLALGSADSHVRPALALARAVARAGDQIDVVIVPGPAEVTQSQLEDLGIPDARRCDAAAVLGDPALVNYDAVFCVLPGSTMRQMLRMVQDAVAVNGMRRRPLIVTGWGGINYEKQIEGLLWRVGADALAVNCPADMEIFAPVFDAFGHDRGVLVPTGFLGSNACSGRVLNTDFVRTHTDACAITPPTRAASSRVALQYATTRALLAGAQAHPPSVGAALPRRLVFATQALVPPRTQERSFILYKLLEYAEAHPKRQVILKMRSRRWERSFHDESIPYEALLRAWLRKYERPKNLVVAWGPLDPWLSGQNTLVVSVSSTATIDALQAGCATAVLSDFGVKESLGNHYFYTSGLLTSLNALIDDCLPRANADWLAKAVSHPKYHPDALRERLETLWSDQADAGAPLPFAPLHYPVNDSEFIDVHHHSSILTPRSELLRPRPVAQRRPSVSPPSTNPAAHMARLWRRMSARLCGRRRG